MLYLIFRQRNRLTTSRSDWFGRPPQAQGCRSWRQLFGRGLGLTLTCDESAFEGTGMFLFGQVLEEFFAAYVSINSFTETTLRSTERGQVMRWPPRLGQLHTL